AGSGMQDLSGNGASGRLRRCENPFVLSGTPLPRPRSNQIAAKHLTAGNRRLRGHHPRPVTAGNQKPASANPAAPTAGTGMPAARIPPVSPKHHLNSGNDFVRSPGLDHDDLIAELTSLGGTPDGVMSHPELMELLLPAVRADLTSAETAPTIRDRSLDCPVTAYSAEADPTAPHDLVSTWERVSSGPFSHRQFPGHHFYLQDHWQQLVDDM